jgi:hypothetical protein
MMAGDACSCPELICHPFPYSPVNSSSPLFPVISTLLEMEMILISYILIVVGSSAKIRRIYGNVLLLLGTRATFGDN